MYAGAIDGFLSRDPLQLVLRIHGQPAIPYIAMLHTRAWHIL